ncbi:hypothetical protein ACHAWF_012036, partial [Thalassiosira exigua]
IQHLTWHPREVVGAGAPSLPRVFCFRSCLSLWLVDHPLRILTTLGEVRCAQRRKDSHVYAYLATTRQGSSGPCLVFCNSIAAVRRVGETFKALGLPAKTLHAQMAQVFGNDETNLLGDDEEDKAREASGLAATLRGVADQMSCAKPPKSRLGALESLRTSNSRSVVVASDVAARGLDIPSVTTVVHYDVARVVDTFIHRAGRTARGVGEKAVGTRAFRWWRRRKNENIRKYAKQCEGLDPNLWSSRLLNEAQERVALATKIVSCNDVESQVYKKNKWLQDAARDAELEVEESMLETNLLDGDRRDCQRFIGAKQANAKLRRLLAKGMRKQHYGKFLSGAGVRDSLKAEEDVKPFCL